MANSVITTPTLQNNKALIFSDDSDIKNLIRSNGIYDKYDMKWYSMFSRFGIIDPYNALLSTKEYIFITKPDLCILNNAATGEVSPLLASNPFFVDAVLRYPHVAAQLQSSYKENDAEYTPFMTMLSNTLTSTLDLPGISADVIETAANIMGTKISYRGTSYKSDIDHDFTLEFEDTKYLDIYMLFKMYDEYEKLKWNGNINLSQLDHWKQYIINKVLHDQVSIYKFIVADDGYRIIYWAKLTGCFPTSVPREAFSDTGNGSPQKISVSWKCHFVRDMDPVIINQFNKLVEKRARGTKDLPIFDMNSHTIDSRWAYTPFVSIREINDPKTGRRREYFLRWRSEERRYAN